LNNPELTGAFVLYEARETFFPSKTVIDPSAQYAMSYTSLNRFAKNGEFKVIGKLEPGFPGKLKAAILASPTLSPKNKRNMIKFIGL